jgi:hypothetical protein
VGERFNSNVILAGHGGSQLVFTQVGFIELYDDCVRLQALPFVAHFSCSLFALHCAGFTPRDAWTHASFCFPSALRALLGHSGCFGLLFARRHFVGLLCATF